MWLKLEFHGTSSTQKGYMVIDEDKMIIGFLPEEDSGEAEKKTVKKRDQFALALTEHVYPYIQEPAIMGYSMEEDFVSEAAEKMYHLKNRGSYITFLFDTPVDFKTVWIFLLNIPASLLREAIHPECVDKMLIGAKDFFCEHFDENEAVTNDNNSWLSMPSFSSLWFFGGNESKRSNIQNEANKAVEEALLRDAEWRKAYFI